MMIPTELITQLRHSRWRFRTALCLLPPPQLPRTAEFAARWGIGHADIRTPILTTIAPQQRLLDLTTEQKVIQALDALCHDPQAPDCLLVANLDLLLAKLGKQAQERLWETLFNGFPHRPRALLLAMPTAAPTLPSESLYAKWVADGRTAVVA
jgi:hypothetical protein